MTGTRFRRLLALIVLGAIVIRAVRELRGNPTRTFDRPASPIPPPPDHSLRPVATAPVAVTPTTAEPIVAAPATPPSTTVVPTHATVTGESPGPPSWVAPVDGSCPDGYPVKAKLRSGIFHLPGLSAYERTTPDRCYPNANAAVADGLRVAKR